MIISKTPLRVSFLGGGTDYPEHFRQHGGATLVATIDKFTYLLISRLPPFHEHKLRIGYSKTELVKTIDEIQHPSVRECLRFLNIEDGLDIVHISDLPARTGLGSSSSFTVGLLNALYAYRGQQVTAAKLAAEAVYVEREMIRERVGLQDQYACAYGGFLHIQFGPGDRVRVTPLIVPAGRLTDLEDRLMLFYTRLQRNAHDVLAEQIERTSTGQIVTELGTLTQMVGDAIGVLCSARPLSEFGELLHSGWSLKRNFSSITSNDLIDKQYERARQHGAVGGKLLGAGGGGFLLFYVEPEHQAAVRRALAELPEVSFRFDRSGSRILFYEV